MPRTKLTTEQKLRRQIDLLKRQEQKALKRIAELQAERDLLAMLSADIPMFYNPIYIAKAKKIRDRVLRTFDY